MNKSLITPENIKKIYQEKGYKLFENDTKEYNLNIFGIRSSDMTPNSFNDYVCIMWKYNGEWNTKVYEATTDPGLYYLEHPMNVNGTAIIVPGQYSGAYNIGLHGGKYEALRQKKPMKYYRDNDRDKEFDLNENLIFEQIGYTNIHHASYKSKSTQVDKWSAGCQVIAAIKDWNEFIGTCKKSRDVFGNSFSYTLLNEKDFS